MFTREESSQISRVYDEKKDDEHMNKKKDFDGIIIPTITYTMRRIRNER